MSKSSGTTRTISASTASASRQIMQSNISGAWASADISKMSKSQLDKAFDDIEDFMKQPTQLSKEVGVLNKMISQEANRRAYDTDEYINNTNYMLDNHLTTQSDIFDFEKYNLKSNPTPAIQKQQNLVKKYEKFQEKIDDFIGSKLKQINQRYKQLNKK